LSDTYADKQKWKTTVINIDDVVYPDFQFLVGLQWLIEENIIQIN